jgi:hypothetical protein
MQRAFTWIFAATIVLALVAAPIAIACVADSEGLQLIDGELPGGG